MKILYLLHNHPKNATGGTEIFAYNLFREMARTHEAILLAATTARHDRPLSGTAFRAVEGTTNELLYWGEQFDFFTQSTRAPLLLAHEFTRLLKDLSPDIVHFHHTLRFGVEAIKTVRDTLPHAKIFYTLHDYLPICHRDGMMVRTDDTLCDKATAKRCHGCFPEIPESLFMMRTQHVKQHFALVDRFIAPSEFLAARYRDWGIAKNKITVIRNGHLDTVPPVTVSKTHHTIGFFGQFSPYKGILLLLEAMRRLEAEHSPAMLHIHGSMGEQTEIFKRSFEEAIAMVGSNVVFHGAYRPEQLPALMEKIDWVVVPSLWWENAPLVIDEAFAHGKPVICSGIGGMAEKVAHGVNGLHVPPADAAALAETLATAANDAELYHRLVKAITPPPVLAECAAAHETLYRLNIA